MTRWATTPLMLIALVAAVCLPGATLAQTDGAATATAAPASTPAEAGSEAGSEAQVPAGEGGGDPSQGSGELEEEVPDAGFEMLWTSTLIGQYRRVSGVEADNGVGGFFDQYEFTANKSSSFPFELGIRDHSLDVVNSDGTPVLQVRFDSPTANLGVSGSQVDQLFLNERMDVLGRLQGTQLDFRYWRMRTEELRLFPDNGGSGLPYTDLTGQNDRFQHDRTGFDGELRLRPSPTLGFTSDRAAWWAPQLSVRGGYDARDGLRQYRFILDGSNQWTGISQQMDQTVGDVGGGLLTAPGGLFTLTLDADYRLFRHDSPTTFQGQVDPGNPNSPRVIGFTPDTDQTTGTIRIHSRPSSRMVIQGGFQISQLKQVDDYTPGQQAAGLLENSHLFYSANLTTRIDLTQRIATRVYFKYDQRDNDIQRDTVLFNADNGTQSSDFLRKWQRMDVGAEATWRASRRSDYALGVRFELIDRTLEPATPGLGNRVILPENWLIADETQMWEVYGKAHFRPLRSLSIRAKLGYRGAPATGYITDLDDFVHGELRVSYGLEIGRPVLLSAFVKGSTGKNRDFDMVSGLGPNPPGPLQDRDYDRSRYLWGVTANTSVRKDVSLFASFFMGGDRQDQELVLSNLQRYFQEATPIDFYPSGSYEFQNDDMSFILGSHSRFGERTDGGISYGFTRAKALYEPGVPSVQVDAIADSSLIDSRIHSIDLEVGHQLRAGLRLLVGYRFQHLSDDSPLPDSPDSVDDPFDLSGNRHTVIFGVTLTNELLGR